MNKFLFQQLQTKVERFFEGKSDLFVLRACQWLSYGGALKGRAEDMSDEEFDQLVNLVGKTTLANWLSDERGESQFFSKLSLSDRDYLQTLHALFADECFHRFKKMTLKNVLKNINRRQKYAEKRVEKLYKQFEETEQNQNK